MAIDLDYEVISDLASEEYWLVLLNVDLTVYQQNIIGLWKNAFKIVCLDGAVNRLKHFMTASLGNREKILRGPDYIIGDADSIDPGSIKWLDQTFGERSYEIEIIIDQDSTDFNKSLQFIKNHCTPDPTSVIALNCFSGRLDHTLDILNSAHQFSNPNSFNIQLMDESNLARIITKRNALIEFPDSTFLNHSCGLLPLFGPVRLETFGLHWEIANRTLEFSGLISTSNRITRQSVKIVNNSETATAYIWTHQL